MAVIPQIPSPGDDGGGKLSWLRKWGDIVRLWAMARDPAATTVGDPREKFVTRGELIQQGLMERLSDGTFYIPELTVQRLITTTIATQTVNVGDYIQSTGYSAGVSGWRINGDGTAEFEAVSIRGELTTSQIATGAAVAGHHVTEETVTVDGLIGTPTGTFTDVLEVTFTPEVDCVAEVVLSGWAIMLTPTSGGYPSEFATITTRVSVNGTPTGSLRFYHHDAHVGLNQTVRAQMIRTDWLNLTGGTPYTILMQAQKLDSATTTTIKDVHMRVLELRV